jgi:hypothetical protein
MTKQERKLLEGKLTVAITETLKSEGLKVAVTQLKNIKKHSKAIAKKLVKTTKPAVVKSTTKSKAKPVSVAKTAEPKDASKSVKRSITRKK